MLSIDKNDDKTNPENLPGETKQQSADDSQRYNEYFATANDHTAEGNLTHTIKLLKSDMTIIWDQSKGSVLELCESVGLTPPNNCRMGTCGTCETKLVTGDYEYDPEPFMEPLDGKIFICCARPLSDMEIEL
jgi:ferredoxin